jgi:hypothetical protein
MKKTFAYPNRSLLGMQSINIAAQVLYGAQALSPTASNLWEVIMRAVWIIVCAFSLMCASEVASGQRLPSCSARGLTRHGNEISITTEGFSRLINQKLARAHSHFSDLQLKPQGGNKLKMGGNKDGTPMAISGPLKAEKGQLVLHADHITKNGTGEMVLMSLFGKTLSDYLNLKNTPNLSADGNNLRLNPDGLFGVHGTLQAVQLRGSNLKMDFASAPCR